MNDEQPATPQPAAADSGDMLWCETCEGGGTIDEALGGYSFSDRKAACPDCNGNGWWRRKVQQPAAASAGASDEYELRALLAVKYAGAALYGDDGELQDNRTMPYIDFKRDSVAEIIKKMQARLVAALQSPPVATATEFCWLVELQGPLVTQPSYHTGFTTLTGESRATRDPYEAKRYRSKAEAVKVADKLGFNLVGTWAAVEHGFDSGPPAFVRPVATAQREAQK